MNGLGVFIPILALMIPIVAIVMNSWRKIQERKLEIMERGAFDAGQASQAKIEKMEARIAVLERIVTDKRISLSDEIDRLGK